MLLEDTLETTKDTRGDEEIFLLSRTRPWLFATLVARYEKAFLRRAERVLYNKEDAQDAVQDTFVKLYSRSAQFTPEGEGSFRSWAYTVLINTCLSFYQKRKRAGAVGLSEELEAVLADPGSEAFRVSEEHRDHIESVLARMPLQFSSVLRRFFLEEKSQEEIAREEGISVGATKARVHRAKALFRKLNDKMNGSTMFA
ncbi:MAG TPA: sigma-70 family RNA polymerase sigma factor [Candidatus Paceibacterota bacterium]|nr:sigma-70 family RNA polymerase sigma factor [Candidatus Paceibacterota bacterium]